MNLNVSDSSSSPSSIDYLDRSQRDREANNDLSSTTTTTTNQSTPDIASSQPDGGELLNKNNDNTLNMINNQSSTSQSEPTTYTNHQTDVAGSSSPERIATTMSDVISSSPIISGTNCPVIRVPGTYPPEWLADHLTDTCMACSIQFTLIKRRHHCRACGKIFCADCCKLKAKLLYLDSKEARVCNDCHSLIEYTLSENSNATNTSTTSTITTNSNNPLEQGPSTSSSLRLNNSRASSSSTNVKVQGVLKTSNQSRSNANECNTSSSSSSIDQQQLNKQVIFADGIRPGTDLSESFPYPVPSSSNSGSTSSASFSLLSRQNRSSSSSDQPPTPDSSGQKRSKSSKNFSENYKNITVCDELGYLPPIVISDDDPSFKNNQNQQSSNSLTSLIANQFRSNKKSIQASMESRSCPLNGVIKFEEISRLVGSDGIVTFLLLKDFYLKVKLVDKLCCFDKMADIKTTTNVMSNNDKSNIENNEQSDDQQEMHQSKIHLDQHDDIPRYWCFASDGLSRFGQNEIVLVIDKEKEDSCIPRDVFKIYLTLHELALRRQSLENLGNLLFQDGLFANRDTAGLLFVRATENHCLNNLVLPNNNRNFLFALILQRWEVPWSKVFPIRLLLRLGHKLNVYPYPLISFRIREPVYYEVGHTIISILGDFRNFRYSITHVDGLKVMLDKKNRKVLLKIDQSSYQQFNKVLDSSNNEHVLAWSSGPIPEANGHLVSVQNEDGQYESVEFFKRASNDNLSFDELDSENKIIGASFIIFSGALKVDQYGRSAKISIVEDGLLIQIQSCTMSALKNAIHFMHHFDIDCENNEDPLNRVEIDWKLENT